MIYYQDNSIKVFNSNCRNMSELEDESIQMCVTSPPYWGLRKYSGNQENDDWGCAFGLEKTPELYVSHSIEILREIKRVLRKDGVCFWNCGDSYASTPGLCTDGSTMVGSTSSQDASKGLPRRHFNGIKPKDLCLIPFRVAIAAQEDGWYVRSDIIWNKPNPMPESVQDRPTNAYEHIFLFTKSSRYYWDMEAVREKAEDWGTRDRSNFRNGTDDELLKHHGLVNGNFAESGRNLRDVWTFPTQPYKEAHFATFPEALPERCIKAGSKEGDTVLDPFAGSGTSLWIAKKLGRKAVGYELSSEYCELIVNRNRQQVLV